jgi:hypothetical protein
MADDEITINVSELRPLVGIEVPVFSSSDNPETILNLLGGKDKVVKTLSDKEPFM